MSSYNTGCFCLMSVQKAFSIRKGGLDQQTQYIGPIGVHAQHIGHELVLRFGHLGAKQGHGSPVQPGDHPDVLQSNQQVGVHDALLDFLDRCKKCSITRVAAGD